MRGVTAVSTGERRHKNLQVRGRLDGGSAGCFTSVYSGSGVDTDFDIIIDELTKARVGTGIYVGEIQFQMSASDYADLKAQVVALAGPTGKPYVWEGAVSTP
jgi:hypothetical protein